MVIWLDVPRPTVMRQVLWNGNRERWANLFSLKPEQSILVWSWTRHAKYRHRYDEEMRNAPAHRQYLRLDSRQAVERFLAGLSAGAATR